MCPTWGAHDSPLLHQGDFCEKWTFSVIVEQTVMVCLCWTMMGLRCILYQHNNSIWQCACSHTNSITLYLLILYTLSPNPHHFSVLFCYFCLKMRSSSDVIMKEVNQRLIWKGTSPGKLYHRICLQTLDCYTSLSGTNPIFSEGTWVCLTFTTL